MSEQLAFIRKKGGGGGKYTETSLWTNPSPTSDFATQTVALSQGISNFKYIAVKYKAYKSLTDTIDAITTVEDFAKFGTAGNNPQLRLSGLTSNANASYSRSYYMASDTRVTFSTAYQNNATATSNSYGIPLEILGLNELDHGKNFDETTLWTNANPTSAFAAQAVTLSDDIDNYDYLKVNYRHSTSNAIVCAALISPSDMKKSMYDLGNNRMEVTLCSEATYFRRMTYASDTSISFSTAYKIGATGSSTSYSIPQSVVGCKFR